MQFLRKTPKNVRYTDTDHTEADILEAYTCWLKNEKLSRKQKYLLKNIQQSEHFNKIKDLVDFAHYRFQETRSVSPQPGSKERVAEKLMKVIRGEGQESNQGTPITLNPQAAYSPQAMGNVDTDVFPGELTPPTDKDLEQWQNPEAEYTTDSQTLAHLNLSFEKQDEEISITDMGSTTPTYVEGVRIKESAPIQEGAEFKCGDITFQIVDIDES